MMSAQKNPRQPKEHKWSLTTIFTWVFTLLGAIAAVIAILQFVTGTPNLKEISLGKKIVNYGLPEGAIVIEERLILSEVHSGRKLILWMFNPTKHPRNANEPYACPETTRGSYYKGPTRISLFDLNEQKTINQIEIRYWAREHIDSFDVPYNIADFGLYDIEKPLPGEDEGKPTIMALRDYNGDGKSLEFALFQPNSCKEMLTTLISYSEKQDKIIQYQIDFISNAQGDGDIHTEQWLPSLFVPGNLHTPGYWKYEFDFRQSFNGGVVTEYEIRYDEKNERFLGKVVIPNGGGH